MSETTFHEICAAGELCELVAEARHSRFFRRWPRAWRVYRLVLQVQRPLRGWRGAHALAARTMLLFCLPRRLGRRPSRRLRPVTWP